MRSAPIQMPTTYGSVSHGGFHRLQRTDSMDAHQLRAHSAPNVVAAAPINQSAWLFDCQASASNDQSADEDTADQSSISASTEDTTLSQEQKSSAHFKEFFGFLDDAHELGYVVKRPSEKEPAVRRCRKFQSQLDLEQPSFERVNRNSIVLQHRYSHYDTLRRIEELRRKHGVKVSLEV